MTTRKPYIVVTLLFCILAVATLAHAGWEEGQKAFARRDYNLALREFLPLAKGGHAEAQLNVAFMYNQGLGVPVDHVVAIQWYRKAAEQGLAEAQAQLAAVYSLGLGVPRNYPEAVKWSIKAAEQGHPQGQFNLGAFYTYGLGGPRDYKKAAFWTRKAAEQGDAAGQFNLSVLYEDGLGVPRDKVEALMWLLLAPQQVGDPSISMPARGAPDIASQAQAAGKSLAARMSPAQIAEAERRAREWKPKPEATLKTGLPLSAQSEGQQPTISEKLEERYFTTLDDWVARGGPIDDVQKTVVPTCGKLVMWTGSASEKIGFLASQRDEFDFRVDVCMTMTVNRVHKQPNFEKPELVESICDKSGILLFTKLCRRSGLR